jgi:hypothetical protein
LNVNRLSQTCAATTVQRCHHKAVGKGLSTPRGPGEKPARSLSGLAHRRFAFADFDPHNFATINHRGYASVLRQLSACKIASSIAQNSSA